MAHQPTGILDLIERRELAAAQQAPNRKDEIVHSIPNGSTVSTVGPEPKGGRKISRFLEALGSVVILAAAIPVMATIGHTAVTEGTSLHDATKTVTEQTYNFVVEKHQDYQASKAGAGAEAKAESSESDLQGGEGDSSPVTIRQEYTEALAERYGEVRERIMTEMKSFGNPFETTRNDSTPPSVDHGLDNTGPTI